MEGKRDAHLMEESIRSQRCPLCGDTPCNEGDYSSWRWGIDGVRWQHYHGYPVGHVTCVTIREMVDDLVMKDIPFPWVNTWDKWKELQNQKEETNAQNNT